MFVFFFSAFAGGLFGAEVLEEFADGVLDDVVDDVGGGVVDAACFFDFGFFFDDDGAAFGDDDLSEELFVDLAEDVGGEDGEFVG